MRFTKEDKKLIARAQRQVLYEEDAWSGRRVVVGYRCKKCRRDFTSLDDLEVDHIYPRSRGGVDSPRNLRLLCPRCNRKKSNTVKRKGTTVKRKASAVKRKSSTVKTRRSTVQRKRR
jgi:5-methylcytosine-specific restriction endonuclease McrA